jgi:molecular chaperone GrpE
VKLNTILRRLRDFFNIEISFRSKKTMSNEQDKPDNQGVENVENISPENETPTAETELLESSTAEATIAQLQKEVEQANQKAQENWDKALRIQAEMENLKRRTQKDLDDTRKYAVERFAKELLTVADSLELGLQAITGDSAEVQKFREGSDLTIKQFEAVFAKFNIEIVNPVGQPFNPEFHQAMAMQPSADAAPNTVLNVFQKGYTLNGRLLRPAMVVVAKAAD